MNQIGPAPACTIVIFGAAGDLTKRLLMPSIFHLADGGLLNAQTRIIGADHNDRTDAQWRQDLEKALRSYASGAGAEASGAFNAQVWQQLAPRLSYQKFDFTDDASYGALAEELKSGTNALFYLAVSPKFFATIAEGLGKVGLLKEESDAFRRVIVEKPFGRDTASAKELETRLCAVAGRDQIFRIDHFLGKEAVYGMLGLRFGSNMIEPLLNRERIGSVQISAAETVGVESRGSFYETTGALRDMVPNHLFSLLTLIAMEKPLQFDAKGIRDAKADLLRAIQPLDVQSVARGQYGAGQSAGKDGPAYRAEDGVDPTSTTETYVALDVRVDNERWRDVPFYIRTGKRMAAHATTIVLTLKPSSGIERLDSHPDVLILGIDPQRGLVQRFATKAPGVNLTVGSVETSFHYEEAFEEHPNVGYEVLLYDAMRGEQALYQRDDMIAAEWAIVQPVLDAWAADGTVPEIYAAGSAGPKSADTLLSRNGNAWYPVGGMDDLSGM